MGDGKHGGSTKRRPAIQPDVGSNAGLSEYERIRLENIARNEAFLRDLGLDKPSLSPLQSTPKANQKTKRKRERAELLYEGQEIDIRRSRRIAKIGIGEGGLDNEVNKEGRNGVDDDGDDDDTGKQARRKYAEYKVEVSLDEDDIKREKITAKSLREFISASSEEHSDAISNEMIHHTVMRIQSMSNKALGTRIKAIARAAGKHSYEKLLVFYYALKASNLLQLSDSAKAALDRLGLVVT